MGGKRSCRLALRIPGPDGELAGALLYRDQDLPGPGVVICPPHPLLAGNMDNNVVQAVAERAVAAGFSVLLFNYRAVGASFNPCPELPMFEFWHRLDRSGDFTGVIADTRAVISYGRRFIRHSCLIGYSFGAFVATACLDLSPACFAAIAPPLREHDFSGLAAWPQPLFFLHAGDDGLLSADSGNDYGSVEQETIPGTDHFFLGHEEEVGRRLVGFLLRVSPAF